MTKWNTQQHLQWHTLLIVLILFQIFNNSSLPFEADQWIPSRFKWCAIVLNWQFSNDLVAILVSANFYVFHSLFKSFFFWCFSKVSQIFNRKSFDSFFFGLWILEYYLIIITMFSNLSNFTKNNIVLLWYSFLFCLILTVLFRQQNIVNIYFVVWNISQFY